MTIELRILIPCSREVDGFVMELSFNLRKMGILVLQGVVVAQTYDFPTIKGFNGDHLKDWP